MAFTWYNSSSPGPVLARVENFVNRLTEIAPTFGLTEHEISNLLLLAEDLKTKWDRAKRYRPVQRLAIAERDRSINNAIAIINILKRNTNWTEDYIKALKIDNIHAKGDHDINTGKKGVKIVSVAMKTGCTL